MTARARARMFVGDRADAILEAYRRARPHDSLRDLILAIATRFTRVGCLLTVAGFLTDQAS